VIDLLKKVAVERQAAVVVVTHDEKIFSRLDRIIHLRDGKIEDHSLEGTAPQSLVS
jgi:putative ABC transport system ATP-binding protein